MEVGLFLIVAAVVVAIDQGVKALVRSRPPVSAAADPPLLSVRVVENPRGGLAELSPVSGAVGLLVLAGLFVFLVSSSDDATVLDVGLGLAWGGAVGNWLDATLRGTVTDYLQLRSGLTGNLADVAIAAGVVLGLLGFMLAPA